MLRKAILAVGLGMTIMAGAAEAGQVVVKNDAWIVTRVQFALGQGFTEWQTLNLGQSVSLPVPEDDGRGRFVALDYHNILNWVPLCKFTLDPDVDTTITVTGTYFGKDCTISTTRR